MVLAANPLTTNNNYTDATSQFTRQTGPFTLAATTGALAVKGTGLAYDVAYDITATPEPTSLLMLGGALTAGSLRRRR